MNMKTMIITTDTMTVLHREENQRTIINQMLQTELKQQTYKSKQKHDLEELYVTNTIMTSVEDDHFLTEGWGCVNLMILIQFESFHVLV